MENFDTIVLPEVSQYVDEGLRDYQAHFKQEIYKNWEEMDSVLLQMPTGTGKTRIFVSMINDFKQYAIEHGERINVLIVTHRNELVEQITNELKNNYQIECSHITADQRYSHFSPKPVCVASILTLMKRMYAWKGHNFDVVIIDEAHHSRGSSYRHVMKTYKTAKFLGVTATPYRLNDVGLAAEYNDIIVSPSIKEFIEAGWLSNYDYYSIPDSENLYYGLSSIEIDKFGDYQNDELWNLCKKESIRAQVVGSYLKYAKGKKGIVYTINIEHNHQLCREFCRCGVKAFAIDRYTKPDTRKAIVDSFRRGEIDVLCNVNIFNEGFDCPDVEFVQLARPTKSLSLYLQQVGRGLRIAPGKEKVIFIDNVGLCNQFGLPSIKRKWGRHFVGDIDLTDYGYEYREKIDARETFNKWKRNPDLSEGCEEVTLIESTGINELVEDTKNEIIAEYFDELKPLINDIFETNQRVYSEFIERFKSEHLIVQGAYREDLLNPYPFSLMKLETDDVEYIGERMKIDSKPIIVNGEIEYEVFSDIDDYLETKKKMVYQHFMKILQKAQLANYEKLKKYKISQLLEFFERDFGMDHNMRVKLSIIFSDCIRKTGDTNWNEAIQIFKSEVYGVVEDNCLNSFVN